MHHVVSFWVRLLFARARFWGCALVFRNEVDYVSWWQDSDAEDDEEVVENKKEWNQPESYSTPLTNVLCGIVFVQEGWVPVCGPRMRARLHLRQGSQLFCWRATWAFTQQVEGRTSYSMWCFGIRCILPNQQTFRKYIIFYYWQNVFAAGSNVFAGLIWPAGRNLETTGLHQGILNLACLVCTQSSAWRMMTYVVQLRSDDAAAAPARNLQRR